MLKLCCLKGLGDDELNWFKELATDKEAVDVNCTDDFGKTPLMLLCSYNLNDSLYNCVKILIQNRHDIKVNHMDYNDYMEKNALMQLCAESESDEIVEMARLLIAKGID